MSAPKGHSLNPKLTKDGFTKKEAEFIKQVPLVGPKEAARIAHPDITPESQGRAAIRHMDNPSVVLSISKTLESQGVRDETLCQAIKRGLDEENPKAYLKAAEIGFKLKGHLKDNSQQGAVQMTKDVFVELCSVFWGTKPQ